MPAAQRDPDNLRAHRSSSILVFSYVTCCLRYWLTSDWPASKVEETQLSIAELKGYVRTSALINFLWRVGAREGEKNPCEMIANVSPMRIQVRICIFVSLFIITAELLNSMLAFHLRLCKLYHSSRFFGVVISFPSGFLSLSPSRTSSPESAEIAERLNSWRNSHR